MKLVKYAGALAALSVSLGVSSAASADTYLLNVSQAQSALPAPYGQVDVTESGAGQLSFTVTLFDGLTFVDTGAHHMFTFSLDGVGAVTFGGLASGLTGGGSSGAGNVSNSPYGGFDFYVNCGSPACSNGGSGSYAGPLTFTVDAAGLTLANLGAGSSGYLFAADTLAPGRSGVTGTIAGGTPVPGVPEPATWAMLILGFGMVGAGLRLRRQAPVAA